MHNNRCGFILLDGTIQIAQVDPVAAAIILCQLLQGERAEATAFWQALSARMAPQTHSTRPVNCGWER